MSVAVKKLDGVDAVDVSLEKASADIRLKPGNKITVAQLRKVIRSSGYPTKDARVEARGQLIERDGILTLDLLNGTALDVVGSIGKLPAEPVEVAGVSHSDAKGRETLTITSIR